MVDKNDPLQGIEISTRRKVPDNIGSGFPKKLAFKSRSLLHVKRLQPEDPQKKNTLPSLKLT